MALFLGSVIFLGACGAKTTSKSVTPAPTQKPEEKIVATAPESKKVGDPRDPEVVYAEGLVKGLTGTTLFMAEVGVEAERWLAKHPHEKIGKNFDAFLEEFTLFFADLQKILKSPALGVHLRPQSPEVKKLYAQLAKATDLLLAVLRGISENGGILTIKRNDLAVQ